MDQAYTLPECVRVLVRARVWCRTLGCATKSGIMATHDLSALSKQLNEAFVLALNDPVPFIITCMLLLFCSMR